MRVPGTRVTFGLDAILGIVPGVGDVAGGLASGYIIVEAARAGASRGVLDLPDPRSPPRLQSLEKIE